MGVPIYMKIQSYIKSQIASGLWTEDMLIPTEAELSKEFACSRITVTTALRELVKDGVIYRIQGKGTYVARQASEHGLYDRVDLTRLAVSLEATARPGSHKCVDRRIIKPDQEVAQVLGLDKEQQVIALDRMKYIEAKSCFFETLYLPLHLFSLIWDNNLDDENLAEIAEFCGVSLGKTYVSSYPVLCDAKVGQHLQIPVNSPLVKFSFDIRDAQGRPVACEIAFSTGTKNKVLLD